MKVKLISTVDVICPLCDEKHPEVMGNVYNSQGTQNAIDLLEPHRRKAFKTDLHTYNALCIALDALKELKKLTDEYEANNG